MIYPFQTRQQLLDELREIQRLNFFYVRVLKMKSEANQFLVKQLNKLTQKYRLTYIHTYTGFIRQRNQGLVLDQVSLSLANLLGYDVEELEGARLANIFTVERYPEFLKRFEALPGTGEIVLRSDCLGKDGKRLPVLMTIKRIEENPANRNYYLLNVLNLMGLDDLPPDAAEFISV